MFKIKYYPNRSVAKFKAQLIAQSFSQIPGIDFAEIFTPMVRKKSLQIYLAICLFLNLIIYQVDIIETYLESDLSDNKLPIFITLPLRMHKLKHVRGKALLQATTEFVRSQTTKKALEPECHCILYKYEFQVIEWRSKYFHTIICQQQNKYCKHLY